MEHSGWKRQSGFIWAVLGSVVGFANILSFSSQCYRNGGGAFLIPYLLTYLVLGFPLLLLEGLVGQKNKQPLVSAYGQAIGFPGRWISWVFILACLTIGAFYVVLTGYSLIYAFLGIGNHIPFDTAHFFKEVFLGSTHSITDFGRLNYTVLGAVCIIALFVWWTLTRSIASGIEKICSFIMPLLAILVVFFAVLASCLPGAMIGIYHFLCPDFSRLLDAALWRDVFGQVFFSLSLGLGIITGYSQYGDHRVNLKKAMTYVAIGDFVISFIAGWVIFACIGYMSHSSMTSFDTIVSTDSVFEIGFILFPKILSSLAVEWKRLLLFTFFFCVFIAGITGVFSIVESVAGNVEREFRYSRKKSTSFVILCMSLLAVLFCMGNGQLIIGALTPAVLGTVMIVSALCGSLVFMSKKYAPHLEGDSLWGKDKKNWLYYTLKGVIPLILCFALICSLITEFVTIDVGSYLRWFWIGGSVFVAKKLACLGKARQVLNAHVTK